MKFIAEMTNSLSILFFRKIIFKVGLKHPVSIDQSQFSVTIHKNSYEHLTNIFRTSFNSFLCHFQMAGFEPSISGLAVICSTTLLLLLTNFILTNLLQTSYKLLTYLLQTYYKLLTNFLQTSYKLSKNVLQNDYKMITK